jgi:hypothetical protein
MCLYPEQYYATGDSDKTGRYRCFNRSSPSVSQIQHTDCGNVWFHDSRDGVVHPGPPILTIRKLKQSDSDECSQQRIHLPNEQIREGMYRQQYVSGQQYRVTVLRRETVRSESPEQQNTEPE